MALEETKKEHYLFTLEVEKWAFYQAEASFNTMTLFADFLEQENET